MLDCWGISGCRHFVEMLVSNLQGDTCNLIGCLLTGNQLQTQVYTAM